LDSIEHSVKTRKRARDDETFALKQHLTLQPFVFLDQIDVGLEN